jgi:nucleoside-diphosphate-sugar epimerase
VVIVAVPPRRTPDVESSYPARIGQIIPFLQHFSVPRVLFISSTSVYPESAGTVSENDAVSPNKDSGKALLKAEKLLQRDQSFQTTILRFGGLIGADRNPARFLSREKGILDGSRPVNLIHRDDCIQIILGLTEQNVWGDVFNACCPLHPSRKEFYEKASAVSGFPVPRFGTEPSLGGKIVDSSKLINRLGYKFIYPDPVAWLTEGLVIND